MFLPVGHLAEWRVGTIERFGRILLKQTGPLTLGAFAASPAAFLPFPSPSTATSAAHTPDSTSGAAAGSGAQDKASSIETGRNLKRPLPASASAFSSPAPKAKIPCLEKDVKIGREELDAGWEQQQDDEESPTALK